MNGAVKIIIVLFVTHETCRTVYSSNPDNTTKCFEQMKKEKILAIKDRLSEALALKNFDTLRVSKTVKSKFLSIIHGVEKHERHLRGVEEEVEKTFVFAVDPSRGGDHGSSLVAHFPVSEQTKQRTIAKVGDEPAVKAVHIHKPMRISIQLKPDDLQRWWTEDSVMGLFVEAFVDGYNIAIHPQTISDPSEVDFVEFGWDFILAPQRYNAHICRGECTKKELPFTTHTRLANEAAVSPIHAKPNTVGCCHPSE
ncbi:hypothetical protein RB195_025884 [Necator americanus]|uniref:TGF-beta family profile domain-containing protein n=1 Tax=Necator americanus TaxID=51031 RepID=A0ABR1EUB6_NECAM